MTKREKTKELFVELINEQLKPHNVTYEDVKNNPQWYMEYKTTKAEEEAFIEHCVDRIRKVLKINKSMAIKEAQWFILQWGLTLSNTSLNKQSNTKEENKNKKTL
jgi:hypothetical protein